MDLNDVFLTPLTERLLKAAGKQDAEKGVDIFSGWRKCAQECGFDPNGRTMAEEAYLDGYYSYTSPAVKKG